MLENMSILTATVQIVSSALAGNPRPVNAETGKFTAEFIETVYEKLFELESKTR